MAFRIQPIPGNEPFRFWPITDIGGVALFMRGYEPSDIPADGDYTIKSLAIDVLSPIAQFGEDKAALVGHDWGAHTAYAAAAIGVDRLSCICTLAIAPYPLLESGVREFCARPYNFYLGFGKPACWWLRRNDFREIDRLYRRWSPHWRVPDPHIRKVKSALSDPARTQAALGYYSAPFSDQDRKAIVRNIEVPTLEQYPNGLNHRGSIRSDKIALYFKELEHLYPINRIAEAIPFDRMML